MKNLQVEKFNIHIQSRVTTAEISILFVESNIGCKVRQINLCGNQTKDVMEQLSIFTRNVEQLHLYSDNSHNWLSADILRIWKLKRISLNGPNLTLPMILLIVQTCAELTCISIENINDTAVIAIAQHCSKLETLLITPNNLTYLSLSSLSDKGLPLKHLYFTNSVIPNIPDPDIAMRCAHALSCIQYLYTGIINVNTIPFCIPYMTRLNSVHFHLNCVCYMPLFIKYCHRLTKISMDSDVYTVTDIMSLCRANPSLKHLNCYPKEKITDILLIELVFSCPNLHTLSLSHKSNNITDKSILALSELCPQLQELVINKCNKVTEGAVLHLIQRCRKLTRLVVSSSSLSEESWTQLDKSTQKRVIRW